MWVKNSDKPQRGQWSLLHESGAPSWKHSHLEACITWRFLSRDVSFTSWCWWWAVRLAGTVSCSLHTWLSGWPGLPCSVGLGPRTSSPNEREAEQKLYCLLSPGLRSYMAKLLLHPSDWSSYKGPSKFKRRGQRMQTPHPSEEECRYYCCTKSTWEWIKNAAAIFVKCSLWQPPTSALGWTAGEVWRKKHLPFQSFKENSKCSFIKKLRGEVKDVGHFADARPWKDL